MYYLIAALYVLVCLVMLFAILLQQGKGGDIASAFGGGSSQAAFGARTGATVLSKITAGAAALFMVLALALSILGQRGPGSVVSGTPAPKPPALRRHRLRRRPRRLWNKRLRHRHRRRRPHQQSSGGPSDPPI